MLASLSLLVLAGCLGWWMGKEESTHVRQFAVQGSSMVPTFWGKSSQLKCDRCNLLWRVDRGAPTDSVRCWHCGEQVDPAGGIPLEPDVVRIHQAKRSLRRGDVVAVRWKDQLHLKRIAGVPGDSIRLDGSRLLFNEHRLEDLLTRESSALLSVDLDSRRSLSHWQSESGWERDESQCWIACKGASPWLVYHHQSVQRGEHASGVWDDYPSNVTLQRKLYGVDRFSLRGELLDGSDVELEVAFWSAQGNRTATRSMESPGQFSLSYHETLPDDNLPVTKETPVAIRILSGPATIKSLELLRQVEYRLRPHDDRIRYPITVPDGFCFVLGDNVPVSIDSRELGLIGVEKITGVIK
ncbi:MAG: S26 family signal peptidase [Rubripirellula sp.]